MKFMCMMTTFLVTGTIVGAEWFQDIDIPILNHLKKERARDLIARFNALPAELQHHILFHYFNERNKLATENKEKIKKYRKERLIMTANTRNYDLQEYYSFKNWGTKCCHVIVFFGRNHSQGLAFIHTLENDKKITTIDCMEYHSYEPHAGEPILVKLNLSPGKLNIYYTTDRKIEWTPHYSACYNNATHYSRSTRIYRPDIFNGISFIEKKRIDYLDTNTHSPFLSYGKELFVIKEESSDCTMS
jgi:hypothetical protein